MDSFCWPSAPCPMTRPNLMPLVPDVSLLLNQPNTYGHWKNNILVNENLKLNTTEPKKQVRFNNPADNQNNLLLKMDQPYNRDMTLDNYNRNTLAKEPATPPMNKVFKNKQFQEIYMANIPNRQLDLSLLIKPTTKTENLRSEESNTTAQSSLCEKISPPKKIPTTYKEFLETQENKKFELNRTSQNKDDCVTDIFNYSSPKVRTAESKIINYSRNNIVPHIKQCHQVQNSRHRNINCLHHNNKSETISIFTKQNPHALELENKGSNSQQEFIKSQVMPVVENERYRYIQPVMIPKVTSLETTLEQIESKKTCDTSIQTSFVNNSNDDNGKPSSDLVRSDEPTVKDLLKIIQQQNEQLLLLQKQVASLLDFKDCQRRIEAPDSKLNFAQEKYFRNKDQVEVLNSAGSTPRKGPLPKFSIDLMTSFEVSIRPQQNMYQRKPRDFISNESKIQEITETDSNNADLAKRINDTSLHLQQPISIQENCPSPEPSIKIDMKDYESSEEDDDDVDATSSIGSAFYKNLMDQVNKIIQNAQKQSSEQLLPSATEELKDKTMNRVKNATIKHLKRIGVNFSTINESNSCTGISDDSTSEQISFAVKQLLMKYLPDEQLAKLTAENTVPKKDTGDKIVLNSRAPEFSFATLKFMKKYNLISSVSHPPSKENFPARAIPPKKLRGLIDNSNPKILDISALKQQPKLL